MPDEIKSINQHEALANTVTEDEVNILVERLSAGTDPATQEHLKVVLGDIIKKGHYTKSEIAALLDGKISTSAKGAANGVASLDANGKIPSSQIPSSVATQADLAAEASSREAKDSDLQTQIANANGEIDNIEEILGGESQTENTDPSTGSLLAQSRLVHHVNLLPNGKFGRVGARSVAWNQLAQPFSAGYALARLTATTSAEYADFTATESGLAQINRSNTMQLGHKYLVMIRCYSMSVSRNVRVRYPYVSDWRTLNVGINAFVGVGDGSSNFGIQIDGVIVGDTFRLGNPVVCDLTIMSMATGYTVDQLASIFCGSYGYDSGHIYDLNPTGFRIRGINLWDEEVESGTINSSTGQNEPNASLLRSKNYIPVTSGKEYFILNRSVVVLAYDINKNFLGYASMTDDPVGYIASTNGVAYLRFRTVASYGTTYNHDVQVADNSLPYAIKATYHSYEEHTVDTPQISDGHYVNENVYDYVENIVEDGIVEGKKHTRVGSVVITSSNLSDPTDNGNRAIFSVTLSAPVRYLSPSDTPNIYMAGFIPVSQNTLWAAGMISAGVGSYTLIYVIMPTGTTKADMLSLHGDETIYYELAEEVITDCEPLRSFGISDYSTVEPITPQDELVNRIDVPFSVVSYSSNGLIQQIITNKDNIENETATRAAQISNHEKRIRNLEHKAGDYEVISYPDTDYGTGDIPANVMEYAELSGLKGVGRGWNQLIHAITSSPQTNKATLNSFSDELVTFTATAYRGMVYYSKNYNPLPSTAGKVLLIALRIKTTTATDRGRLYCYGGYATKNIVATTNWQTVFKITTTNASWGNDLTNNNQICFEDLRTENWDAIQATKPMCRDLSLIAPEFTPSGDENADMAYLLQRFPDLLTWDDMYADGGNGYGFVKAVVDGVTSKGFNLWPETWETGAIDSNGANTPNLNRMRSAGFIEIPITTLYFYAGGGTRVELFYYNENKVFCGYDDIARNSTFTPPFGAKYMRFSTYTAYGSTYNGDICINKSNVSLDGTYKPWKEPDVLEISPASSGYSAGSAYDTDELNVEVLIDGQKVRKRRKTQNIVKRTFGTGWVLRTDGNLAPYFYKDVSTWGIAFATSAAAKNNIFSDFYRNVERTGLIGGDMVICTDGDVSNITQIQIKDSRFNSASDFSDFIKNEDFYYETKNPTVTLSDPILDNRIKVEPNGRFEAVQTNSPKVDSAFDIGYMYA